MGASFLPTLFELYERVGLRPLTGYSPYHMFNWRDAPFTRFKEGNSLRGCAGLSVHELMMLDGCADLVRPAQVLVLGNSWGFSTLALALMFPNARVAAVDIAEPGVKLTNELAAKAGLDVTAVVGRTPDDVHGLIAAAGMTSPVDYVLIDAEHTSEAIVRDFSAVRKIASDDCLYVFHDVINHHMINGFDAIVDSTGFEGIVLTRSASGMAMLSRQFDPALRRYLSCFSDSPEEYREYREYIRDACSDAIGPFAKSLRPRGR